MKYSANFRRAVAHATGVAALLALSTLSARPAAADPVNPPRFDRPFYAGVYLGDAATRTERIEDAIRSFSRLAGKQPALVKSFHVLGDDFAPGSWAGELLRRVHDTGSTSVVALDLRYAGAPRQGLLKAISSGRADPLIRRHARQIAALGIPVLISPGWEMNGRWNDYSWQGHANGGAKRGPAQYVAAYRRIVDLFRREGAHNVKWVFSPNVGNAFTHGATGPAHWNWYGHYYPGDRYVDYLGPHGYNGSTLWGGSYQDFETAFDSPTADHTLSDMERRFPGKPIIIAEYASEEARGRDKGEWITRAYDAMRRHPSIVGAIWFHMDKETDWRINSSRSALKAYRMAMEDPNIRTRFR